MMGGTVREFEDNECEEGETDGIEGDGEWSEWGECDKC